MSSGLAGRSSPHQLAVECLLLKVSNSRCRVGVAAGEGDGGCIVKGQYAQAGTRHHRVEAHRPGGARAADHSCVAIDRQYAARP